MKQRESWVAGNLSRVRMLCCWGLALISPVLNKLACMTRMDLTNVFDLHILFDRVRLSETDARVVSKRDRGVDRYNLYRFLDHTTLVLSTKITGPGICSRKVNDGVFLRDATFFESPTTRISTNATWLDQLGPLYHTRVNLTKRIRNHACPRQPRIDEC
jgi:hypothetical protein